MAQGRSSNGSTKLVKGDHGGSALRSLLNGGKDYEEEARKVVEPLKEEFPIVAELLGGIEASGNSPSIPGGTITIFVHQGRIKWSANVKGAGTTLMGEVADIVNIWGSINSAMLVGDVSSKGYTERNNISLTEEQKALLH